MDSKRRKEQSRQQKQQDRPQRRAMREGERHIKPEATNDKDADLKKMIPGAQPGRIL